MGRRLCRVNCNFPQVLMDGVRRGRRAARNAGAGGRAQMRQVVRSIVDSRLEHKRADVFFAVNSAAAGAVSPLTQGIVQGLDISQRSGDRIIVTKLQLFITSNNIGAAGAVSNLRVVLFSDKLNTGTIPAVTDVLASADYADGYNPVNLQANRFKVYLDTTLITVQGQANSSLMKEYVFKMKDRVQYNGATNVATSNGAGALFMLFIDKGAITNYRVGVNLTYLDA